MKIRIKRPLTWAMLALMVGAIADKVWTLLSGLELVLVEEVHVGFRT